ncbi:MAG: DNA double-strand break repair nuclease NurA, partial [Nitrospiria bacterium]
SKERRDFVDIVRITAELLGGLSALERTPDLRVLMFHGPLVYLMSGYAGHTPFTEDDIDLFLRHYMPQPDVGRQLKEDFLQKAQLDIYPKMTAHSDEWVKRSLFEPLAWIAYLYQRLLETARQRNPTPIIAGVVERGTLRQFSEQILLERVFRGLRQKGKTDYFNRMYGRSDLISPKALIDRLGYTDALLLAMLLQPGEYSESWMINKYSGLSRGKVLLPDDVWESSVNWAVLKPSSGFGFPGVSGCYLHVSETTEPLRIEVFKGLGDDQIGEAAGRAYLYARLLPGYGFPVGLDIVDKHAHVPDWLTSAYGKLIRYHLGVSLQQGEISDAEMRRILVQAIYMTHRDWLFRPRA